MRLSPFITVPLLLICFCSYSQWALQSSGTDYRLNSVYFINNTTGFLGSNSYNLSIFIGGEILRTSNGGINWQQVLVDTNMRTSGFYFLNENTGFAVGGTFATHGSIFKTSNGGINWVNITPQNFSMFLHNIQFLDMLTGYAGGKFGVIKTTNGGAEWNYVYSFNPASTNISFSKVSFPEINTGYYLADSGKVLKTSNGGENWQSVRAGGDSLYFDIKFLNAFTGFICGENGRLYKTVNGGNSWVRINLQNNVNFYSIFFNNELTGYISGLRYAMKTTNGGDLWFNVFEAESKSFWSVYFSDQNTGYLASDTGIVYKTTTGGVIGINPVSTEVPEEYSLSQNYPNPFNPTTNIKFSIPKAGFVRLAVYDMLGREVENLVSQQLSPGTYRVDWNASKFSSGIYMYKLITNDFSLVKKMSLIK